MSAAANRQPPASRGWTHHIPDTFFERPDLDPRLEHLAIRLERFARDKPWCLTSNDELMAQLGCSRNTLAAALRRGEQRGWFRRVLVPGRHGRATGRLGIVLFVRPTDRPVATPETFDQVVDQMKAEIARGHARTRPRTLPFTPLMHRASMPAVPRNRAPSGTKDWAPPVPRNRAPSYSKEETLEKTTTETGVARAPVETHTSAESSSSSLSLDSEPEPEGNEPLGVETPEDVIAPQVPAAGASNRVAVQPPAPIGTPPAPPAPCIAPDLPAELVAAAAEAIPGASRGWVAGLLRDCGGYGLDLALLVVVWVKTRRPQKPMRYAQVALSGWLNKLRSGAMTLEDVRAEVQGRSGPRASPRPFDPKVCLARLASVGWAIVPHGGDQVIRGEIPGRGAPLWSKLPEDLRQQVESHKAELKAYVLERASERGKTVALRA